MRVIVKRGGRKFSRGSVATDLRCGGILDVTFTTYTVSVSKGET